MSNSNDDMPPLGFDPSLTSSGFAYHDMDTGSLCSGVIKTGKLRGVERLEYLRGRLKDLCFTNNPSMIIYEGYSMGSHSGRTFDIGELGGVLKMFAYSHGFPILLVPPSVLKKFITRKGNASKEEVVLQLYKRFGYEAPQNDEADAIGLFLFGEAYLAGDQSVDALAAKCQLLAPRLRPARTVRRISA